jgi:transposase
MYPTYLTRYNESMRTFEYRLYPNRAQRQQLMACLIESRAIYNEMLAALKAQYEADGTFPTNYDLNIRFKGRGGESVPATTVQMLSDRLSKALKRFLQLKELGVPCGFPRFKTANRWHSIQLRQYAPSRDAWLDEDDKHLHVPAKLGKLLKIKLHRPLIGTPVTAHLVLRADGHWYALIVCATVPQDEYEAVHPEQRTCEHPAIGLDVGLKVFLADSAGGMVENPRHYRRGAAAPGAHSADGVPPHERQPPPTQGRASSCLQALEDQLPTARFPLQDRQTLCGAV